jgi:aminoglycoside/choline kinase family phosphotransferase
MGTARERERALTEWAVSVLKRYGVEAGESFSLEPASDDASFRRYFRGAAAGTSYILVDAPPELEDSHPFVQVSAMLGQAGLNAPVVHAHDLDLGFMMLTDLGDSLYLDAISADGEQKIGDLYDDAIHAIVAMQKIDAASLPVYDEVLLRQEMNLFVDWFLPQQLSIETSEVEKKLIEQVFASLVANAVEQPQAFVHRDYHSRNLMVTETSNPGILDFQDAVAGPITYDLVSLLKDCYHRFPRDVVQARVDQFYMAGIKAGLISSVGPEKFMRWFDLMGMQRHIKVAGIFSRLNLRDGKPRYLDDIPLVLQYILEVCDRYPEFSSFKAFLDDRVLPGMDRLVGAS